MDDAPEGRQRLRPGLALNFTIAILALAVLALGIYPPPFTEPTSRSTLATTSQ
jgi:hypothetical protein